MVTETHALHSAIYHEEEDMEVVGPREDASVFEEGLGIR